MKRILVPLDGSEFAERALEPAGRLAARSGAELHLTTVVSDLPPVPLATGDGEMLARWFEEEEDRAGKYLQDVKERVAGAASDGAGVETHVRTGPVARTLQGLADELDADLLMLTTHGRGAWQRAWLGSIADQLLRQGERPLLLLRDEEGGRSLFAEPASPRHILVPLDGSRAAETVFGRLGDVLPEADGRVTLAAVLQRPFPLATSYLPHALSEEQLLTERRSRMETYLEEARRRVVGSGVSVETRIVTAEDTARGLLDFVRTEGVELIALSTRGRGGVSRALLGSVADKLVRGSPVPLLTVRRPGEEE